MRSIKDVEKFGLEHFGEVRRPGKYGLRMVRELYAIPNKKPSIVLPREMYSDEDWAAADWVYEDAAHTIHSDEFCARWQEVVLANYDLNLAYFSQIPIAEFEGALAELLSKNKRMKQITDLREVGGIPGVYVMVLDGYKQAYIGQAKDVRSRIMRHWSGVKQFDRLVFGNPHESVISIDSFRALDTTRIYALPSAQPDTLEARLVSSFPADFLLNRMGGGKPGPLRGLFIDKEMKRRQLTPSTLP